jgi:hypothetical protein
MELKSLFFKRESRIGFEILNENSFRAMLKVKASFLEFKKKLKGKIVGMAPPDFVAANISLECLS